MQTLKHSPKEKLRKLENESYKGNPVRWELDKEFPDRKEIKPVDMEKYLGKGYQQYGVSKYFNGLEFRKDPPSSQSSIFESTVAEEIEERIEYWIKIRKSNKARLRNIAQKFKISEKEAEKHWNKAIKSIRTKMEYEYYKQNKDTIKWLNSARAEEYSNRFRELVEEKRQKAENRRKKIKELTYKVIELGEEHLVEIPFVADEDLARESEEMRKLAKWYRGYYGPISKFIEFFAPSKREIKKLYEAGYIKLAAGKEGTLYTAHPYGKKDKAIEGDKCGCGRALDTNLVGLNEKLGYKEGYYKCLACLQITNEYASELIQYYKSNGCNKFK